MTATDRFGKTGSAQIVVTVASGVQSTPEAPAQPLPPKSVDPLDLDEDGYQNDDETACGSNPNSAGSVPDNFLGLTYPTDPNDPSFDSTKVKRDAGGNIIGAYLWPDCRNPDDDQDGMPDWWEIKYGLNPHDSSDAAGNRDGDGYSNLEEYLKGTDPTKKPLTQFTLTITDVSGQGAFENWLPGFEKVLKVDAGLTGIPLPAKAVFTLESTTKYPGRAINDPDPAESVTKYPSWYQFNGFDFGLAKTQVEKSFSQGPVEVLDTADGSANGSYSVFVQCWDYGGRTKLVVTHPTDPTIRTEVWIPKGSGTKGIGQAWDLDGNPGTANEQDPTLIDPNADGDEMIFEKPGTYPSPKGDGLSNLDEYRGILYTEGVGAPLKHLRLNPNRKDLFVRSVGYDPVIAPFAIGDALKNAGVDVHITTDWGHDATEDGTFFVYYKKGSISSISAGQVTGSNTGWSPGWPNREWEFRVLNNTNGPWVPITSFSSATSLSLAPNFPVGALTSGPYLIRKPLPPINEVIVYNDRINPSAAYQKDGYINFIKAIPPSPIDAYGARAWDWDQKGHANTNSTTDQPTMYGFVTTYQIALEHYFGDRPYAEGTVWTGNGWTESPTMDGKLAPLSKVEDQTDGLLPIDGAVGDGPNGNWDGDYRTKDPSQWLNNLNQVSPFDVDGDGLVELPMASDPDADNYFNEHDAKGNPYTFAHVLKHTITHELCHALAGGGHSTDRKCIMYGFQEDWARFDWMCDYYRSLLRIHNLRR